MKEIREGSAEIEVWDGVFFNPRMKGLRDLSALFVSEASGNGRLLDCTAATGIRGIRYAKEAGMENAVLLDMNRRAYENSAINVRKNGLVLDTRNESVQRFANTSDGSFDVIDLDPFGSPAPELYDIMKVSRNDTLLMVTATDTAVLCGAHSSACLKIYGAKALHSVHCKEAGIRILIGYIIRTAAQFNFGCEAMLSVSDMHYMRAFVKLGAGAGAAVASVKKLGFGTYCRNCVFAQAGAGNTPRLRDKCEHCGGKTEAFGPLFTGRLKSDELLARMEKSNSEAGLAKKLSELRSEIDALFFFNIPAVTKSMGISSVSPSAVMEKLAENGYSSSSTQFSKDSIKTEAGPADLKRAVREARESLR